MDIGKLRRSLAALILLSAAGVAMALPEKLTRRFPLLENADVKVWKSVIAPNQPLSMHRHDHPRVIIALQGGRLNVVQQSGASHTLDWETDNAYWLDSDPPGQLHADVNAGGKPIEVIVVELKKAQ